MSNPYDENRTPKRTRPNPYAPSGQYQPNPYQPAGAAGASDSQQYGQPYGAPQETSARAR